jgi:hypothetical protein
MVFFLLTFEAGSLVFTYTGSLLGMNLQHNKIQEALGFNNKVSSLEWVAAWCSKMWVQSLEDYFCQNSPADAVYPSLQNTKKCMRTYLSCWMLDIFVLTYSGFLLVGECMICWQQIEGTSVQQQNDLPPGVAGELAAMAVSKLQNTRKASSDVGH